MDQEIINEFERFADLKITKYTDECPGNNSFLPDDMRLNVFFGHLKALRHELLGYYQSMQIHIDEKEVYDYRNKADQLIKKSLADFAYKCLSK